MSQIFIYSSVYCHFERKSLKRIEGDNDSGDLHYYWIHRSIQFIKKSFQHAFIEQFIIVLFCRLKLFPIISIIKQQRWKKLSSVALLFTLNCSFFHWGFLCVFVGWWFLCILIIRLQLKFFVHFLGAKVESFLQFIIIMAANRRHR